MRLSFEKKNLILNNKKISSFDETIEDAISFEKSIVVLLNRDEYNKNDVMRSRNVVSVDFDGSFLWRIPALKSDMPNSSYVSVTKEGRNAKLVKFDGTFTVVDPGTGEVLLTPLESMKGRRLW